MTHDSDIWLADLMRGFERLQPADEATRACLARMAGFDWRPLGKPQPAPKPGLAAPPPQATAPTPRPPAATPIAPPPGDGASIEEDLPLIGTAAPEPGTEWEAVKPLEPPPSAPREQPPYLPLFRPEWGRHLATTLARIPRPMGPVDEEQLTRAMSQGTPVTRIPRRPIWSLSLGVQLLLDVGPGMEPFAGDQIALAALFRDAVGPGQTREVQFADCPSRGVIEDGEVVAYSPPDPGVPVVAVSDLGLGGPPTHLARSRPVEWLALARRLAAQGSHLRILVPYERSRWSADLRDSLCLIEWDRPTTAGSIRRLIAQGVN